MKSWHEEYEQRLDLSSGYVRSKPKYSQIQKEQAVKHYAEHGRCIASTVKALGYPCRDLLRAWIHELDPDSRQRVVGRAVSAPRPPQLKKLAEQAGKCEYGNYLLRVLRDAEGARK